MSGQRSRSTVDGKALEYSCRRSVSLCIDGNQQMGEMN